MNDKRMKAIAKAFLIAMALIFLGLIIYLSLRNIARSGGGDLNPFAEKPVEEEITYDAPEEVVDTTTEIVETSSDSVDYTVVSVDDQVHTISDINIDEDDIEGHDFEIETTLVNTLELLPTITNEREMVAKTKVDTSKFPDSYALTGLKTIELGQTSVSIPKEVYLYNCGVGKSSDLEVSVLVSGDSSALRSIGWNSSDTSLVTVSSGAGEKVTLSAVDSTFTGYVPVSVLFTFAAEKGKTSTQELILDVYVEGVSYGDSMLHDLDGNQLYLDEAGAKMAYISDFGDYEHFYGSVKTTGWQTMGSKRYYYDGNSTPVTGHQIIGGLAYDFDSQGVLASRVIEMGIDVSKYQKDIDWDLVAASGISFAIIRCGFRGAVSGYLVEDPYFYKNVKGATDAGIAVGVYFFTQATTEREAVEEASMAISMCRGYDISLPIYIDSEGVSHGRANNLDRQTRTDCLRAFCETINSAGYEGGVYASKSWFDHQVYAPTLEKYNIWVAQYNSECTYTGKTNFWQYSSKEFINGIVGYVDCDVVREAERR